MRLSQHPNIVRLHQVILEKQSLLLVFEYAEYSLLDLISFVLEDQSSLSEAQIRSFRSSLCFSDPPAGGLNHHSYQILQGLHCLHENGWLHRDLKPENILILNNICKIADFGLSRIVAHAEPPFTPYVSTRWYRAPELLLTEGYYSTGSDIWYNRFSFSSHAC